MIVAALLAGAVLAAPDPSSPRSAEAMKALAPAFKGTIVNVYPDGRSGRLYLNADKTYRYTGRTGTASGGVWTLDDGDKKVCLRQRKPIALPIRYCTEIPSGETWTAKAQTGEMLKVHVEAGRKS